MDLCPAAPGLSALLSHARPIEHGGPAPSRCTTAAPSGRNHDRHRPHHCTRHRRRHRRLGRLILPGRQDIPLWLTILVGIVAALVGTFLARALGIPTTTSGIDWLELLVQLALAVIGVAIVAGIYTRRGAHR